MKLALSSLVPAEYTRSSVQQVVSAIENQVNLLAEGRLTGRHFNATAIPTTGNFSVGDIVWDSAPAVSNGTVRLGWICTTAGSPGTLQEMRVMVASFGPITNSIGADVALNNTGNYFDGPSVAQGTSGTWFVSGSVSVKDTAGAGIFVSKLWDGTTVIASGLITTSAINERGIISLSGYIVSPAANLRISVRDTSSTSGLILFNDSGNSKDSTITAIRDW
jgi:hypothetical protein